MHGQQRLDHQGILKLASCQVFGLQACAQVEIGVEEWFVPESRDFEPLEAENERAHIVPFDATIRDGRQLVKLPIGEGQALDVRVGSVYVYV